MKQQVHIAMKVNNEPVEVSFAPYKTLLEVLREDLNLCGTKHGCELGECGACAVLLDDLPVLSCLVLAVECDGRRVHYYRRSGDRWASPSFARGVCGSRRRTVWVLHTGISDNG